MRWVWGMKQRYHDIVQHQLDGWHRLDGAEKLTELRGRNTPRHVHKNEGETGWLRRFKSLDSALEIGVLDEHFFLRKVWQPDVSGIPC